MRTAYFVLHIVHLILESSCDEEASISNEDSEYDYDYKEALRQATTAATNGTDTTVAPIDAHVDTIETTTLSSLERYQLSQIKTTRVTQTAKALTSPPTTVFVPRTTPAFKDDDDDAFQMPNLTTTDSVSMETLSGAAYIALMDKDKQPDPSSHSWTAWNNRMQNIRLGYEGWLDIRHVQNIKAVKRVCYAMGVTYMNSMQDIRRYFKIRYLYYNTLEYEIGYMVQQIIWKYQVVLELFHTVQAKFVWYRNFAPTTYMFYMYTNILQQCRHIIHLCNMLHEVELKYQHANQTMFDDYHLEILANEAAAAAAAAMKPSKYKNSEEERMKKQKRRERRERKKQRLAMEKKGIYTTTPRTKSPRKSGRWDLHYGWSIETW